MRKKKIVIVSTYPAQGSKNIGDKLITNQLIKMISEFGQFEFSIVWRAASWASVRDEVLSASHVFFACLAIRRRMHEVEYPYLSHVVDSGIPFSVIAAGTALPVGSSRDLFGDFSQGTKQLLKRVSENASVATTRGYLSQEACKTLGLEGFQFSGDIAFFHSSNVKPKFQADQPISKIVISDPHRSSQYLESFKALYKGVQDVFPTAQIVVAQHGVNAPIDDYCADHEIKTVRIYENPDDGLEIYSDTDLHVGFRVHAHVSALSRGTYSYLLEQDGRGCDYGLTIDRKISVPNYSVQRPELTFRSLMRALKERTMPTVAFVPTSPAKQIIAMIREDQRMGFQKFSNLENQIESFNQNNLAAIEKSLGVLKC